MRKNLFFKVFMAFFIFSIRWSTVLAQCVAPTITTQPLSAVTICQNIVPRAFYSTPT